MLRPIQKRRVRSLEKYLGAVPDGAVLVPITPASMIDRETLDRAGLEGGLAVGTAVLPPAVGPITKFNAQGREVVHKDRPKETYYRHREWTRQEWHGPHRQSVTTIISVPFKRYPRTKIAPPSDEIVVAQTTSGNFAVCAPTTKLDRAAVDTLIHRVNTLLELFGYCELREADLSDVIAAPLRRLNWEVLPRGKTAWAKLQKKLDVLLGAQTAGARAAITHRLETVNGRGADFVAVGRGGFRGYFVFGFTAKDLYVLESSELDNATYVFKGEWEDLSKLTKAEILDADLHHRRLIHTRRWAASLAEVLR